MNEPALGYEDLDLNQDGVIDSADAYVDLKDLAMAGLHFRDGPCTGQNTWCSHADINLDGRVDWLDVQALAGQWLTGL